MILTSGFLLLSEKFSPAMEDLKLMQKRNNKNRYALHKINLFCLVVFGMGVLNSKLLGNAPTTYVFVNASLLLSFNDSQYSSTFHHYFVTSTAFKKSCMQLNDFFVNLLSRKATFIVQNCWVF